MEVFHQDCVAGSVLFWTVNRRLRPIAHSTRVEDERLTRAGRIISVKTDDTELVTCPYCGEEVEIYVELDVRGSYVQDCEVCCNPWTVSVSREGDELFVEVSRADGTD